METFTQNQKKCNQMQIAGFFFSFQSYGCKQVGTAFLFMKPCNQRCIFSSAFIKMQQVSNRILNPDQNSQFKQVAIFDRSTCSKRSKELAFLQLEKFSSCHLLNFSVFHHVFISSLDMFKNCINSYHIQFEQVQTCLKII